MRTRRPSTPEERQRAVDEVPNALRRALLRQAGWERHDRMENGRPVERWRAPDGRHDGHPGVWLSTAWRQHTTGEKR